MTEAISLILLDSYVLSVFNALYPLSPLDSLRFQTYLGASLIAVSSALLILGGFFAIRSKASLSGMIVLVSGTMIPMPIYLYFAEFSEPPILGWLGTFGILLFLPGLLSGVLNILILLRKRRKTKNVEVADF
ncbi:MAG: hypothetical protein JSV35_06695 [Candidatus Bathyarchaeota archaeon]|nr:MAG: hypothetical protein JSV35_06695 [Candidatus Bathyarchaeota archaeon]